MNDKFYKYCAEVIGAIEICDYEEQTGGCPPIVSETEKGIFISATSNPYKWNKYNPFDDLNQMAEVVEKLVHDGYGNLFDSFRKHNGFPFIKPAFRDFIISTMPEDKDK